MAVRVNGNHRHMSAAEYLFAQAVRSYGPPRRHLRTLARCDGPERRQRRVESV